MISKRVLRLLTLLALLGLNLGVMVPAASAVDTEIPACPFTISSPGNYFLKKDLTATGTNCIQVEASNVAIDMKGHTVTGDGTHDGITDDGFFVDSVAIANGKIKKFHEGIDFFGCCFPDLITLERIEVSDNREDGIFIEGCCNSITDVKANNNGDEGVQVDDCCTVFNKIQTNHNGFGTGVGDPGRTGDGLEVNGCCNTANQITANDNTGDGIEFDRCCTGVSNSQANDNKLNGIQMFSDEESVANVKTNGNSSDGIAITSDESRVTNATANNNGADGIRFGSDHEEVADSVANNNRDMGIDVGNSDFNTVTDVTTNHNATGVKLFCPGNAVNVRAHNNSSHNLSETGGTCTNLLDNAPPP